MENFSFKMEQIDDKSVKIFLEGKINEDTNLKTIFNNIPDGVTKIILNTKSISSINSYGVRLWINTLTEYSAKYEFKFEELPIILINQINMIYNFLPENSEIISFYAPFYCEDCDEEEDILININEINIVDDKIEIPIYYCKTCSNELEFDDLEDEYFSFVKRFKEISINKNKLRGKIVLSNLVIAIENSDDFTIDLKNYLEDKGYNVTIKEVDPESQNFIDIVDDDTDLLICGFKNFNNSFIAIKQLKDKFKDLNIVILTQENLANILVKDWIEVYYPDNIITFVVDNKEDSLAEIGIVVEKLLTKDIFGIEKYFKNDRVQINEIIIKDAFEKNSYIDTLLDFATSVGVKYRLLANIESIADEMIMNAIYNAPVDENGNSKYTNIDRKTKIVLEEKEYAKLRYGYDGEKFIISVIDNFGRLTKDKIISYLQKCFVNSENPIENKPGGAGIGLYLIYKQVHQFIVNIEPGKKTEVIAIFFPHKRKKDIINKMFHIFVK